MSINLSEEQLTFDRSLLSGNRCYRNRLGEFLLEKYRAACQELKLSGSGSPNPERFQQKKDYEEALRSTFETNFCEERVAFAEKLLPESRSVTYVAPGIVTGDRVLREVWTKLKSSSIVIADSMALESAQDHFHGTFSHPQQPVVFLDRITTGPDLEKIAIDIAAHSHIQTIVGIGGGRTMDIMKFLGWKTKKYMVAFPTSLATHVYASPKIHALKPIKELGYELTIHGHPPHVSILEATLLEQVNEENRRLIRAGLGDLMAFYTARQDWHLSINRGMVPMNFAVDDVINFIIGKLESFNVDQPLREWILDYFLIQVLLCQITDWVGSAPASGSEHLFAAGCEDLVSNAPLHGELVALGTIIMTSLHGKDALLTKNVAERLGLPLSISEIGVSKEVVIEALVLAKAKGRKKNRHTIFEECEYQPDDFQEILQTLIQNNVIRW